MFKPLLIIVLLSFSVPAMSKNYALLVAISDYPDEGRPLDSINPDLQGPDNDLRSLKESLVSWSYVDSVNDIVTLSNYDATREAILSKLVSLEKKIKKNDKLLFYFSGHGTGPDDPDVFADLPHNTGALVPAHNFFQPLKKIKRKVITTSCGTSVALHTGKQNIASRLIIGKRDLRPIFECFDKTHREVLVLLDACHSELSSRGHKNVSDIETRYFPLEIELDENDLEENIDQLKEDGLRYPYEYIYTISASERNNKAQDIPRRKLQQWPTIDGLPHGAFTDALLRVLNNQLNADHTNDGKISNGELFRAVRRFVVDRGYGHTPTAYPLIEKDVQGISQNSYFKQSNSPKNSACQDNRKIRVSIKAKNRDVHNKVMELGRITISDVRPDFILEQIDDGWIMTNRSDNIIKSFDDNFEEEIVNQVAIQSFYQQLKNCAEKKQAFQLTLDYSGNQQSGILEENDRLKFVVTVSKPAYVALLVLQTNGKIGVLYPGNVNLIGMKKINVDIPKLIPPIGNEIIIRAPFGIDHVFAIASQDYNPFFHQLGLYPEFSYDSSESKDLQNLLKRASVVTTSMEVVTRSKGNR
jgi:hypothetical protein